MSSSLGTQGECFGPSGHLQMKGAQSNCMTSLDSPKAFSRSVSVLKAEFFNDLWENVQVSVCERDKVGVCHIVCCVAAFSICVCSMLCMWTLNIINREPWHCSFWLGANPSELDLDLQQKPFNPSQSAPDNTFKVRICHWVRFVKTLIYSALQTCSKTND